MRCGATSRWAARVSSCSRSSCCVSPPRWPRRPRPAGWRARRHAPGSGFAREARRGARDRRARAERGARTTLGSVTLAELAALTRQRLAARERRVVPPGPLVRAAVLVPLIDRGAPPPGFAKRTHTVGTPPGQISFPGAAADPRDTPL